MGQKEDFDQIVENMLRQLLAKDLMYEPMSKVCDKYPEWLAEKYETLSQDEYQRYGTQYQYFQRIVAVYKYEPDNFPRLVELLQDLQKYGQVPSEIIKELAPALEFGPDGMPVMNLGENIFPKPGAAPGMPVCDARRVRGELRVAVFFFPRQAVCGVGCYSSADGAWCSPAWSCLRFASGLTGTASFAVVLAERTPARAPTPSTRSHRILRPNLLGMSMLLLAELLLQLAEHAERRRRDARPLRPVQDVAPRHNI